MVIGDKPGFGVIVNTEPVFHQQTCVSSRHSWGGGVGGVRRVRDGCRKGTNDIEPRPKLTWL